jgi:hypothetical protein
MPEAARLEQQKDAFRVTRLKAKRTIYRLAWYPEASDSPESPAHITLGDTYRVAGVLPMNEIQRERLIGLNLIPVPPELLAAECQV